MLYEHNLNHANVFPLSRQLKDTKNFIGPLSFDDYRSIAEKYFPFVLRLIDPNRITGNAFYNYVDLMNEISWEFEDPDNGGRGVAYNIAQRNSDNRKVGILSLLKCFSVSPNSLPGQNKVILDALGGNGTITRFLKTNNINGPKIISADISGFMVNACVAQRLPCIRQSATRSLFRDSSLDGILVAYGSHHLDDKSRKAASAEAFRTLKTDGRYVLHDFEIGTAAAQWFDKIVHRHSRTGHPHRHFSRNELYSLLHNAGFQQIRVFSMPDPFILRGETAEIARKNAIMHIYNMYDLVKIAHSEADMLRRLELCIKNILGEIYIEKTNDGFTATIHRQALVAVGTKANS